MVISIGSDHGGFDLKTQLIDYLEKKDYYVMDFGTNSHESCDYTDFGYKVAKSVSDGDANYGIVICSTGIGMSIIANKVKGIRCALVNSVEFAKLTREHNNSNVLALGAKALSFEQACEIVDMWLNTPFSNDERHIRRIDKITKYEGEN